jgi:hypothetical protein
LIAQSGWLCSSVISRINQLETPAQVAEATVCFC